MIHNLSFIDFKEKKKEFVRHIENILITLSYDVKLNETFKEKQQQFGYELCRNLKDVIPIVSSLSYLTVIKSIK